MDYFERSQKVKAEIERAPDLTSRIAAHMGMASPLEEIGEGTNNTVYRVGQLNSGLWVALRQNRVWGKDAGGRATAAFLYNSYCLAAENLSDAPSFCVGGTCGDIPFLLVEDVTEGGSYKVERADSGCDYIVLSRDGRSSTRSVDLGIEDLSAGYLGLSDTDREQITMGTFDIETLKYFGPDVRLII